MLYRRRMRAAFAKRPVDAIKNVVDVTTVVAAITNTVISRFVQTVDSPALSQLTAVERGCKINGVYMSLFFALDQNQAAAAQLLLMDWYVLYDKGGRLSTGTPTFGDTGADLPIPGATGAAVNKNSILHEEKGLIGEKNDGSKMVFQGVIKIPRGKQRFTSGDTLVLVGRSNFDTVMCFKAIYKWYK